MNLEQRVNILSEPIKAPYETTKVVFLAEMHIFEVLGCVTGFKGSL